MQAAGQDVSYNPRGRDQQYDRIVYQCVTDDVWVTTEVPNGKAGKP